MAAYLVIRINITDRDKYKQYTNAAPAVIEQFGGKTIARGEPVTLEGPEETQRVILIEFPTLAKAKAFYNSFEYQEAKRLREDAAIAEFIAVDGAK